jgi:predicted Zn-dependent protease
LLLQQLQRADEAAAALEAAVALEPRNPDFLLALGDHYLRRRRAPEALAVAERLIAAAPGQPTGQELRAAAERILAAQGAR